MSPNMTGALLMMASMAAFTANDIFVKLTGGAVPLFQFLFLRGILSTLMVLGFARYLGALRFDLRRSDWIIVAIRCVAEIATAYFFLTALFHMPLANITAILQILPLTVTLGAAIFFSEVIGWRRMIAIAIGFCGMLLIVRPGAEGFNVWSVYALCAMMCVTIRDLVTRQLSKDVPSMTVTFVVSFAVMAFSGLVTLTNPWVAISVPNLWMIVGSSFCILGGYFFSIQVMRAGDVGFIAPFRYVSLVSALLAGWFLFDEWPDAITLVGAAIVVGTGLFTLYRERHASRA